MANKIINIGNQTDNSSKWNYDIYKDISMIGSIIKKTKTNIYNKQDNLLAVDSEYLQTEDGCLLSTFIPLSVDISEKHFITDKIVNIQAIQNSLHNIFHWIPGERILNPEFGSKLYTLLYNGITQFTIEQIIAEIRHCISRWEPRVNIINIVNVSNTNDTENNTIQLDIIFSIPSLDNNQYKYSYTYNKKFD